VKAISGSITVNRKHVNIITILLGSLWISG